MTYYNQMSIFKITSEKLELIVRANCLSCARQVAVEFAGAEGTRVWRDPELSQVEVLRLSGYQEPGPRAILKRSERG